MASITNALPSRFPVGTKFVIEGRPGGEGRVYSRYLEFPDGTRITRPSGGFVLWVELPKPVDGTELFEKSLAEGVSVTPGVVFSSTDKFKNCIRISCGMPWSARIEAAVATVGRIARSLASTTMH